MKRLMQHAELEKQDYSCIDANTIEQSRTYHDQRDTLFVRISFQWRKSVKISVKISEKSSAYLGLEKVQNSIKQDDEVNRFQEASQLEW